MDSAWAKIIKVTGSVGVVGFLFSILMNHLFSDKIIEVLGSKNTFYVIVLIVCGLLVALMSAILISKKAPNGDAEKNAKPSKDIKVTYDRKSTHHGDNNF